MAVRIYTRTGDQGKTSLANGQRLAKSELRVEVIGDIDELNSSLGLILAYHPPEDFAKKLFTIQDQLFHFGAELALAMECQITDEMVRQLEQWMDDYSQQLPPLKQFILPNGSLLVSHCHFARSICRRAERHLVKLSTETTINPESLKYLNRLSDLLFIMVRIILQQQQQTETVWDKS